MELQAGKPNLSPIHPAVTVGRLHPPAAYSAAPFMCLLPLREIGLYKYMEYGIMWHNVV